MPDEQHETLTLDDLLGLSGGPSERASEGGFGMLQDSSELLRELVGAEEAAPLSLDNLPSLPKIPAGLAPVEPEKTKPEPQPEPAPAKEAAPEVGEAPRTNQDPKQKARPEQCLKPTQQPRQKQKQKAKPKLESKLAQETRPKREESSRQEAQPFQAAKPKQESKPEVAFGQKLESKPRLKPESQQESEPVPASAYVHEASLASYGSRLMRKGKHARGEAKERAFSGKHAASVTKDAPEQGRAGVATESKPASASKPAKTLTSKSAAEPTPKSATQSVQVSASESASAPEPVVSSTSRLERLNELSRRLESQILASSATFQQSDEKLETPSSAPADTLSSHEQPLPDWCAEVLPEESHLFDEPPQTIAEGMEDGQREHLRIIRIKIALGAMAALLVVGCVVGVAQQLVAQPGAQNPQAAEQLGTSQTLGTPDSSQTPDDAHQSDSPNQTDPSSDPGTNPNTNPNTSPGDPSITPNQPQAPQQDRSGTVVYRYVTNNATGTDCTITETVTFNQEGLCETSDMEVKLADEAAAEAFAQVMQRDYGPDAEVSVEGSTVRAHLSISSNALDREAYEDALRASVRDLTIVKKS